MLRIPRIACTQARRGRFVHIEGGQKSESGSCAYARCLPPLFARACPSQVDGSGRFPNLSSPEWGGDWLRPSNSKADERERAEPLARTHVADGPALELSSSLVACCRRACVPQGSQSGSGVIGGVAKSSPPWAAVQPVLSTADRRPVWGCFVRRGFSWRRYQGALLAMASCRGRRRIGLGQLPRPAASAMLTSPLSAFWGHLSVTTCSC